MSLINDALKKAQRQRTGPADAPPMPGGGHGAARGGSGQPAQMLVLGIAGAVVVVVISVVATVWFLNRAPAAKPAAVVAPTFAVTKPVSAAPDASPVIIAPVIVQAPPAAGPNPADASSASPVTAAPPGAATPAPGTASPVEAAPAAALPIASAPLPSTTPAPIELPLDVRIAKFVENVKVTGILRSGTGSKVLMNDKVFRLGDVVDRALSLRLIKIEADSLTFVDANGTPYIKNL